MFHMIAIVVMMPVVATLDVDVDAGIARREDVDNNDDRVSNSSGGSRPA